MLKKHLLCKFNYLKFFLISNTFFVFEIFMIIFIPCFFICILTSEKIIYGFNNFGLNK